LYFVTLFARHWSYSHIMLFCVNRIKPMPTKKPDNKKQESPAVAKEDTLQSIKSSYYSIDLQGHPRCLCYSKANMRLPIISDQYQHRPCLVPFSHNSAYWPSRSSKVDDFHLIWKGVCHLLLVININLGPISHRFQDMTIFPLKKILFYLLPLNPKVANIRLNCIPQILFAKSLNKWLIIHVKSFPLRPTA